MTEFTTNEIANRYDEYWEQDQQWLLERMPEATENQVDAFCEKVAWFIIHDGIKEERSRNMAIDMINNGLIG